MRKAVSKLHWQGRGALVAVALVVGILGLFLLYSTVRAVPPVFNADVTVDVVAKEAKANSDIKSTFDVGDDPWPAAQYGAQISFTPPEWGVAAGEDIPIGAVIGKLDTSATLGWFNSPCSKDYGGDLSLSFDPLMNCSTDTSDTVSFTDGFITDPNGLPAGCNKYPDFLNTMFPGMTPKARYAGFEFVGINVSLNFVVFEPGTSLPRPPGLPPFTPDKGYVAMSVLNNPTAPLVKDQITDNCPPLSTQTTYYGLTKNNPATAADEKDYKWRTNPECPGTYTFYGYAASFRDADDDDIDNTLDTCPHIANEGNPRIKWTGDDDGDGLDNACDPTKTTDERDADVDGFPNRQDNCPLVKNGDQADGDYDGIGDACDQDDWNNDGDTLDPGEPTGFSPTTPDGDKTEKWFETPIEITGEECVAGGEGDTTLTEDASAGDTEIAVADTTGFAEKDTIEIGAGATKETNWIKAISGGSAGTFTLLVPLKFVHDTGERVVKVEAVPTPTAGTATATATATATVGLGTPAAAGSPSPTIEGDTCSPVFPGTYNGRVLINGTPATSGYELAAKIGDTEWGTAIISGGRYAMDIPDHMPTLQPCFEGGTITFALNGMTCAPAEEGEDEWGSGIRDVDLNCAPVAPPVTPTTAPPPATPTTKPPAATPTLAPTKVPSTGAGGLSGVSSGLPLWAMALASWVGLMTVAGLGTLAAVKRR